MSVTMVGPLPGPFNRTHYSDSSSDSQDPPPQPSVPSQPQPWLRFETPERYPQLVPRDIVPYHPAQPDSAATRPVYQPTYPDLPLPPESQRESQPRPRSAVLTKPRCRQLLRRLAAVGVATVVVALLVMVVRHRGRVHPGAAAPLKGANVVSGGNGTAPPFPAWSATAGEEEERRGHSTDGIPGVLVETARGRSGEARKALPEPSSTCEPAGSTTSGNALRVVPRHPPFRDEDDSPTPEPRAPAATSAAEATLDIDTTAPAPVKASTPAPKTREPAGSNDERKPEAGVAGSDALPASRAASESPGPRSPTSRPIRTVPVRSVADSGLRPAATTATTDVAEIVSAAKPDSDAQEV